VIRNLLDYINIKIQNMENKNGFQLAGIAIVVNMVGYLSNHKQ